MWFKFNSIRSKCSINGSLRISKSSENAPNTWIYFSRSRWISCKRLWFLIILQFFIWPESVTRQNIICEKYQSDAISDCHFDKWKSDYPDYKEKCWPWDVNLWWSRSHSDMRFVRDQTDIIYSDILCRNLVRNHFPSDFQAYSAFEMQDLSPKS